MIYYQKDLIDPNVNELKNGLLYDEYPKAYYDPESSQYF